MKKLPPLESLSEPTNSTLPPLRQNGSLVDKSEVSKPQDANSVLLPNNKQFLPPKKKEAKKKQAPIETIEDTKMALMMFKTSIRNHLDLSSLADNKANTMLSINTLIITVAIPLMVDNATENKLLIIPMIFLTLTCLASMYYATMATRPIKVKGLTSKTAIENGQSDLFFFGNFCNMDYDDYVEGIETVVKRKDFMQSSITSDLYWSGKALGKKFEQLRYSYTIFIGGMLISACFFALSLLFGW